MTFQQLWGDCKAKKSLRKNNDDPSSASCFCYLNNVSARIKNSKIGNIDIKQSCGTCYDFEKGTEIDCAQASDSGNGNGSGTGVNWSTMAIVVISVGIVCIIVILIFTFFNKSSQTSTKSYNSLQTVNSKPGQMKNFNM